MKAKKRKGKGRRDNGIEKWKGREEGMGDEKRMRRKRGNNIAGDRMEKRRGKGRARENRREKDRQEASEKEKRK